MVITATRVRVIRAELVIPAAVGGWWIRELALYDSDGDLIAVANCPASYKPIISEGTGKTQVVRMNLAIAGDANVTLMIDDTPVLATHEHVTQAIETATAALMEQIAEPEGVEPGSYRQVDVDRRDNFLAVGNHAASVTLPPGGTWCYSLMQFFSSGAAAVGRSGVAPGGSVITFGEGHTIYGFAWRFSG